MYLIVASIGGSVGAIGAYNNTTLRLNNRFFIGGDTLRGFAVGGIGPRDANTTDSLGGKYYYTGTAELSFPLGLPKEIGILGKAFVDVGSLWGSADDPSQVSVLDSQLMRVASGIGTCTKRPCQRPISISVFPAMAAWTALRAMFQQ